MLAACCGGAVCRGAGHIMMPPDSAHSEASVYSAYLNFKFIPSHPRARVRGGRGEFLAVRQLARKNPIKRRRAGLGDAPLSELSSPASGSGAAAGGRWPAPGDTRPLSTRDATTAHKKLKAFVSKLPKVKLSWLKFFWDGDLRRSRHCYLNSGDRILCAAGAGAGPEPGRSRASGRFWS